MVLSQHPMAPDAGSKDTDNFIFLSGWDGLPVRKAGYSNSTPSSPSQPEPHANAFSDMKSTPSLIM